MNPPVHRAPLPASVRPQVAGLDLGMVREALTQQWRVMVLFLGAVLLAAGVGTALTERQYQAVALIQLMPRAGQEINVDEVVSTDDAGYLERRDRARTQIQIIQSRRVRKEVVIRYLAQQDPDGAAPDDETVAELAGALKEALSAGPREDTQLVEIRVLWPDPVEAAVLANLVAEVYWEENLAQRTDAAKETRVWLDGQTGEYRESLARAQAAVLAFKEDHDVADIAEKVTGIQTRLAALEQAASETTTERVLLEGRLREHQRLLRKGETEVLAGMFDDPALQALAREHANIIAETADDLSRYGEKHPAHQQARARLDRMEELLAEEVRRLVEAEESELQTLQRQEQELGKELKAVKAELLAKERLRGEFETLQLEEERLRELYGSLGERGAEVDLQARTRLSDVRIVDEALPPTRPAKPNLALNLAMALGIGLFGGFGLALVRHRFDDSIQRPADVEAHLATPLLGVVPTLPDVLDGDERALYAFTHSRSRYAESLRAIREVVRSFAELDQPRRILVTSCVQGEGKTDTAINLAISFARLGVRTLLVDGDLRLPRVHRVFAVPRAPGFAELLGGQSDLARQVRETDVPDLFLLPAGADVENPNELLSGEGPKAVLGALSGVFGLIVIDSPPAGVVADALAVARHVDGVVMVVRRGYADRGLANKTLSRLHQVGARVLGVALNDVPLDKSAASYGASYYDESARRDKPSGR